VAAYHARAEAANPANKEKEELAAAVKQIEQLKKVKDKKADAVAAAAAKNALPAEERGAREAEAAHATLHKNSVVLRKKANAYVNTDAQVPIELAHYIGEVPALEDVVVSDKALRKCKAIAVLRNERQAPGLH
jgi:hypothetical protein